ncbi:MFS transporter [Massilia sp. TS11]|uniref:MFS transporter n=1 Tax=Massilia sp. TS11 TaxID=2908003 RepID=UPI001EDA4B01|nr:MFS transporter [Massilia sp. TS11]MCG2583736.1 MFS transporter [Massilia sp. TS11]
MLEMQKRLSPAFYALISLPSTAMGFALCIQISALSWLLSTKYNLKIDEIGIVWASGPLAGILGQVLIGIISDKAWFWGGRRRPFILIGGVLASLMLFLLPRIDVVSNLLGIGNILVVAVIIAVTLDLAINISFNPTRAIIADVTPDGPPRLKGYTWMQTISGFWGVAAYVIGGQLDNYMLINVGIVLVFLFSVLPMFFIEEPRQLEAEVSAAKSATDWGQLWRIYVAHGLSWVGAQSMFVYIIAFIQQHLIAADAAKELASAQAGQIIGNSFAIMSTVGFLLPAFVFGPLALKIGRVRVQVLSLAIMAAAYFLIAFTARTAGQMYALMAMVGVGWAAIVSLPFAIMSEKVDRSRMGFFMGIFNLSVVLPQLFASLVLGRVIAAAQDKAVVFELCGACLAASAVLWLLVKDNASPAAATAAPAAAH